MSGAKVIQAIQTDLLKRGDGDGHESQIRKVKQFYTVDGRLIAESDAVHDGWVVMFQHLWPKIKGAIEVPGANEENWKPLIALYRWAREHAEALQLDKFTGGEREMTPDFLLGLETMRRFISGDIPQPLAATFVLPSMAKVPHIDPEALQ